MSHKTEHSNTSHNLVRKPSIISTTPNCTKCIYLASVNTIGLVSCFIYCRFDV